jgi:hypothetical protein
MSAIAIPAYRIEHLREGGETGKVVLVDQATEEVVARRHLVDLRFP